MFCEYMSQVLQVREPVTLSTRSMYFGMNTYLNNDMKIAVAGTGYVGLSIATLLAQYNEVVAVDVVPEKVAKINRGESPISDEYIEKYSYLETGDKPKDVFFLDYLDQWSRKYSTQVQQNTWET